MNMIYKTIIEKGLATDDQIRFVRGRGSDLNSRIKASETYQQDHFEMYGRGYPLWGPSSEDNGKCMGTYSAMDPWH